MFLYIKVSDMLLHASVLERVKVYNGYIKSD